MSKETTILAISIVTLMVAGFAVYSVTGFSVYSASEIETTESQASVVEVKDYSKDIESIQSAISKINENFETFESETVKELEQIQLELEDKEVKVEQEPEPIILPFEFTTNKQVYLQNDSVVISIDNVLPQSSIKIDLLSPFNELIKTRNVYSDSTGSVHTIFQLPSSASAGNYNIQVTYNENVDTSFITVIDQETNSESSQSEPVEIYSSKTIQSGITMTLDKEQYSPGDIIRISGVGPANSPVDLKMTDPNTKVMTSHSNSSEDGTYSIIYIIPSDAETGNWKSLLTVGNEKSETTVKVTA